MLYVAIYKSDGKYVSSIVLRRLYVFLFILV